MAVAVDIPDCGEEISEGHDSEGVSRDAVPEAQRSCNEGEGANTRSWRAEARPEFNLERPGMTNSVCERERTISTHSCRRRQSCKKHNIRYTIVYDDKLYGNETPDGHEATSIAYVLRTVDSTVH